MPPTPPSVATRLAALERLLARDGGGRGISALAQAAQGQLAAAAHSLACHPQPSVAIVTGFYVPKGAPPAAETDGPIGAVHLATGLISAGIPALIITDPLCGAAVRVAAGAGGQPIPVVISNDDDGTLNSLRNDILAVVPELSHLIALERVGPAMDGIPRNMRGEDISAYTARLDLLFDSGFFPSAPQTIGIGDGGNEIGMGRFDRDLIAAQIPAGERIACRVATEHTLVCGVSNWGGVALLAALACVREDLKAPLLAALNEDAEHTILHAMVTNGPAVDGVTRQQTLTVDGLALPVHVEFINSVLEIVAC